VTWLFRYSCLLVCATLLLVAAGGMVTSTSSGLSVPDWPTTYGQPMFSFPLSKMVGGIFYEHGHRLIASTVGMLTIGLVLFQWRVEPRRWARRLGLVALAAVILQGVLGGLTVLYFLPAPISIGHAGLAQLFFALTVSLALFASRGWREPAVAPVDNPRLRRQAIAMATLVYMQILIGATMRHNQAGLAIPDFPLAFGHLIPPEWTPQIAIHFAHRACALIVVGYATTFIFAIARTHRPELTRPAWVLAVAIAAQITLGAFVILTAKNPVVNTLHVATGAIVFVTTVLIALRLHRASFS
jgi:cytochrome c oxidase assembly protein subunit 15